MPPGGGLASSSEGLAEKDAGAVRFGLATRVLVLVTAFVIAAATMIYVPAIANLSRQLAEEPAQRRLYGRARAGRSAARHGAGRHCRGNCWTASAPGSSSSASTARSESSPRRNCRATSTKSMTCAIRRFSPSLDGAIRHTRRAARARRDRARRSADGRRVDRDHHGRGAAERGHARLFAPASALYLVMSAIVATPCHRRDPFHGAAPGAAAHHQPHRFRRRS